MTRKIATNSTTNKIKKDIPKKVCSDCHKSKNIETGFFSAKNKILYPDGKISICKLCLKKAIYNSDGTIDINKFKQILQQMDIPFLYDEYERAINSNADSIGIYFKNLNSLPQNSNLTWKDSVFEKNIKNKINNKEITNKDKQNQENDTLVYSKEWRGTYTKSDLEYLNDYYTELNNDFKIVNKNHKDYARKIAKASLAMDKASDDMLNGVSGSDKRYKDLKDAFDSLCKSAQFSEQTRTNTNSGINGIAQIVDKVESHSWIYEREDFPEDELDHLLNQFKNIEKSI
ncbi:MAG: hypothetical protein K0R54_5012 [Clostridiaceae bacterium]|jgi:hypothetical protein|nr:hypothetical protein [Clostridiaceae bacterium]